MAILDYAELLEYGGKQLNEQTGEYEEVLLPLNGTERFNFIKERIQSHYAHIQLNALYEETKEKSGKAFCYEQIKSWSANAIICVALQLFCCLE